MITYIKTDMLTHHPQNPRKDLGDLTELTASIKANGVLQNLTVVKGKDGAEGKYTAVIGHRRLEAAKLAGLTEVPCAVADMTENEQIATMLAENLQRADLTVLEQAYGFQMMLDMGETEKSVAEKTGFSEKTVRKRLFVASLNEKKAKAAYERGATLEDYMKLQEITSKKRRNEVLGVIGTNNFNYTLRNALAEERRERIAPKIIELIKSFAEPTEISSYELKGYAREYGMFIKYEDFEASGKLKFAMPKNTKPGEYLYKESLFEIEIYKRHGKEQTAGKKMHELPPEEQEERREKRRKLKALKEMGETAYRLREEFVKSWSPGKQGLDASQTEALSELAFAAVCMGRARTDIFKSLAGIEDSGFGYGMKHATKMETLKAVGIPAARVHLMSLYSMFEDSGENVYYSGAETSADNRGFHKGNEKLDAIYGCLCALGYGMSDDEKALQDGTHELFVEGVA